jgi:DNA-directed RNA polymerase subunit RPC12/RpoP
VPDAPAHHFHAGQPVRCPHCGCLESHAILTNVVVGRSFWSARRKWVDGYRCAACGHLAFFA